MAFKHREDGPAVEFIKGNQENEYWLNNKKMSKEKFIASKLAKSISKTKNNKKMKV